MASNTFLHPSTLHGLQYISTSLYRFAKSRVVVLWSGTTFDDEDADLEAWNMLSIRRNYSNPQRRTSGCDHSAWHTTSCSNHCPTTATPIQIITGQGTNAPYICMSTYMSFIVFAVTIVPPLPHRFRLSQAKGPMLHTYACLHIWVLSYLQSLWND